MGYVTFGQVFKEGDIALNEYVSGHVSGVDKSVQCNVMARHGDNSVRHAIFTYNAAVGEALTLKTSGSPLAGTDLTRADLPTGFSVEVTLDVSGDALYTSSMTKADIQAATVRTHLSGPLCSEWIVSDNVTKTGPTNHPHLMVYYHIRLYADDAVRVDYVIENNWAYAADPQDFTYDVELTLGGVSQYTKSALVHYHHARWRKTFWSGTEPAIHIKHDIDYLIDSKAVSNYDSSLVIPEADLAAEETDWTGTKTEPMGIGLAQSYMAAGGAAPDLGPLPRWTTRYLLSQDKRVKTSTVGTANLAGSWSIHYRDENTGLPVSVDDYPYMTLKCTYNDTYNSGTGLYEAFPSLFAASATPYTPDDAHQPDFAYLPYAVTGDYYLLEELHFWANYNLVAECPGVNARNGSLGLMVAGQQRAMAWSLRTLGEAAFITPDSHDLKAYFVEKIDNNLTWFNDTYTNNGAANALGIIVNGLALNNGPNTLAYQDDFFTWSAGHLSEMGFTKATDLLGWKSKSTVGRMTGAGFCWTFGSLNVLQVRDDNVSPIYTTFEEVFDNTVDAQYLPMVCASQEMADALGLEAEGNLSSGSDLGSMVGYPTSATGYPSNLQIALSAAVDAGAQDAISAWSLFDGRTVKPTGGTSYENYPNYAIIPRADLTMSALQQAASAATPEVTESFASTGLTGALVQYGGAAETIFTYSSRMNYDPVYNRIHYMGEPHDIYTRHLVYDEATNAWAQQGPDSPNPFISTAGGGTPGGGHGYEHQILTDNGDFWWREFGAGGNSNGLQRWDAALGSWENNFYGGVSFTYTVNSLSHHPNLFGAGVEGIVVVDRAAAVYGFNPATGAWNTYDTYFGTVGLHHFSVYVPGWDIVVFGGGDGNLDFFKLDGGVVTQYGVSLPIECSGLNKGVIVPHPDGNSILLLERKWEGNQARIWEFDGTSWALLPYTHGFYNPVTADKIFLVTCIPEYGILLAVTDNGTGDPYQSILKVS